MRKFLLTLLCLVLISCSSGTTEESVSETQAEETTTTESTTTTSTSTTTTVYEAAFYNKQIPFTKFPIIDECVSNRIDDNGQPSTLR